MHNKASSTGVLYNFYIKFKCLERIMCHRIYLVNLRLEYVLYKLASPENGKKMNVVTFVQSPVTGILVYFICQI